MVIFYFLMIHACSDAPEEGRRNASNLKNGDKVITNGGIYGTVVGLDDDAVQLRIAEQVKIKVSRSAIAGLQAETPKESLASPHEFPAQVEVYSYCRSSF